MKWKAIYEEVLLDGRRKEIRKIMRSEELIKIIETSNKNVIVYCAAALGEYAFALLEEYGISVICFCDNDVKKAGIKILDSHVLTYNECKEKYSEGIYIVANADYYKSALIGKQLEEHGYILGVTYFLFQEIQWDLQNIALFSLVFSNKKIVLQGSQHLCQMMHHWLLSSIHIQGSILYLCSTENDKKQMLVEHKDAIWIILDKPAISGVKRDIWSFILENRIRNICQFFSQDYIYCNVAEETKRTKHSFIIGKTIAEKINKVVFLVDSGCSGSFFIQSLLDSHPNVLYLGWNRFTFDIWRYVTLARNQTSNHIISLIKEQLEKDYFDVKEEMSEELARVFYSDEFKERFNYYAQNKRKLTEREIFIYLQLAYYETLHGSYVSSVVPVIYIDIHTDYKVDQEVGLRWLNNMGLQVVLLKIIRQPIIRLGSYFKFRIAQRNDIGAKKVYEWFQRCGEEQKFEIEKNVEVCKIRFEDLKLRPKEYMQGLCDLIGIPWDDILIETTSGKEISVYTYSKENITGFSLKPVYYQYDEYFSSFDKFRLDLLFGAKSKAYGYAYFDNALFVFTKVQILEIFKFPFKFEKYIQFKGEEDREKYRENLYNTCKFLMHRLENMNEYLDDFDFSDYMKIIPK